jgi:hypothetical protein
VCVCVYYRFLSNSMFKSSIKMLKISVNDFIISVILNNKDKKKAHRKKKLVIIHSVFERENKKLPKSKNWF